MTITTLSESGLSYVEAIILGLIQALTEFLPVSSSGHLVLAEELFNIQSGEGAAFEVAVHLGTLLSIMVLFRREIWRLIKACVHPKQADAQDRSDVMFIIIGSIPAGVIGLLWKDTLEQSFGSLFGVGVALIFTGLLLLSTLRDVGERTHVSAWDGLWVGLAQAVAILPGVSRSGSTISIALKLGIDRHRAARLSFLMSLPVIAGAGLLKALDLVSHSTPTDVYLTLGIGCLSAFIFGIGSLWLMLKWVVRPSFGYFGIYCIVVGIIAMLTTSV
jgi:undecaprenyl-diphosphatase